jgi:hypothetical protein
MALTRRLERKTSFHNPLAQDEDGADEDEVPTRPNSPAPEAADENTQSTALSTEPTLIIDAPGDGSPGVAADGSGATLVSGSGGSAENLDWIPKTKRRARPLPVPVPNLSKKSRGRRVPTTTSITSLSMASMASVASAVSEDAAAADAATPAPDPNSPAPTPGTSAAGRTFTCQVDGCGKLFSRGEHLKRHVRSLHTHEKRE